jgi:hypothetical protein
MNCKEHIVSKQKIFIGIFTLLFLTGSMVSAGVVTKTGTTAAKFLSIGIGPRAIAMGGAFTSVVDDATAMYWNPAGIALINKYQVVFTQSNWIADVNVNYVGVTIPAGNVGSFGVNITALTMDDMEITTEQNPEGTGGRFSAGDYAFGLSFARMLYQDFMLGVNLKYVRQDISKSSASSFAVDIGTIFTTPFWGVKFATSITNFGTKLQMTGADLIVQHDPLPNVAGNNDKIDATYSTESFDLPLRLQIGISKDLLFAEGQRFTVAVDAAHPNDNTEFVNVGGELALFDELVFLRGGYKTLFIQDAEETWAVGAGFNYTSIDFMDIEIDYSYQNFIHLGDVHTFGFFLTF